MTRSPKNTVWVYLLSAALSNFGNSIAGTVWPWLVLVRTGDPASAALVAALIAIPSVVFSVVGGQLIDTFGRKRMSVISDTISALSIVSVIIVDQLLGLNIWWFVIIGIFGAIGDVPGYAARSALLGDVAQTSQRTLKWLAGASQTVGAMTFLVGPALAGVLIAAFPITQVLWITALCSFLAALVTWSLRLKPSQEAAETSDNPLQGWRAWTNLLKSGPIRLLAITSGISQILVMPYIIIVVPAHFQATENPLGMGMVLSSFAIGMMAGGVLSTTISSKNKFCPWSIALLSYSIGFSMMSVLQWEWVVIAGTAIAGIGGGLINPLQAVIITENAAEHVRGRAFSLLGAIALLTQPMGLSAAAFFLEFTTIYVLATAVAGIWLIVALWAAVYGARVLHPSKIA
ncbi:MFS transporter [Corynebacterium sp. ES2794-CONJ1]|uniref:MFS transporter n=1 Tax=unclassified Corynebacterium TaxID=2624378 RepID=UPI002169F539|nr:MULTISPECIES: MFS transporter [unclassified Corynebacterium]MCS4489791.1 MFS transporter [Corynebacterium sp. ES2775-CONJ]MCU9519351.1 MFS transporter [Corynebacterium sp. ES2794-CONJ1]